MTDRFVINPFTGQFDDIGPSGGGIGTVTNVSWVASQGVSAIIANPGTTPAITPILGALTGVTSFNGLVITANTGVITTGTWNGAVVAAGFGGTGQSAYTVGDILYASGAAALSKLSDIAIGNALISGGVAIAPSWGKIGLTTHVSGTLASANGGTDNNVYAVGDILYASGVGTLSRLADIATGNALISGGSNTAPSWGKVGLTTHVSGILGVGNGGTALATVAAGSVLGANALDTVIAITSASGLTALINNAGTVSWNTATGTINSVFSDQPVFTTNITTPIVLGGSGASGNLLLQSTSNAARGLVQVEDLLQVGTSTHAWGATAGFYIDLATSGSATITTGAITGMRFAPTVTCNGNSSSTLMALFNDMATIKDDGTGRTLGPALIFASQNTYTATVAGGLTVNDYFGIPAYAGLYFSLTTTRTGAGTGTIATATAVHLSNISNIGVGWTVTNLIGVLLDVPTVGGTLTNFYGIKGNGAAATNRWFLYETGGMQSSHKGSFRIGDNTAPGANLDLLNDSARKPGVGGLWTVASDERLKEEIELADLDRCAEIVRVVPLKRFRWKDSVYTDSQIKDRKNLGWIAQDVQKAFPKAVGSGVLKMASGETLEDSLTLDGGQMLMALYGAVQKLQNEMEQLWPKLH